MCGIAGIIRLHDLRDGAPPTPLESIPEAWLDTLDESIRHRGPDGAARFRDRSLNHDGIVIDVALVHRRLSIIDHAGGHQPMVHDGERLRPDLTYQPGETPILAHEVEPRKPLVAVAFNGCIYNHRELRKELEAKGHVFETDHSDTEVLVHGWNEWGTGTCSHLDGMAAVFAWRRSDASTLEFVAQPGEKPIWIGFENTTGCRIVCSSAAAVMRLAHLIGKPARPLECPDIERGWIQGLGWADRIYPGNSLWQKHGTSEFEELDHSFPATRTTPHTPSQFNEYIERAVRTRLEADVPLGVFLSGGIDSGLIAAIAKEHRPDIKTFTVRMPDARFDESEAAAETAKHLDTDHHTLDCQPEPASDLVHLIHQLGLPFGDSSLLPTYWVSKAAREHVKVALAGDGGDELFGGYRRHTIAPALNRYRHLLRLIPTRLLSQRKPGSRGTYLARLVNAARYAGYPDLLDMFQYLDFNKLVVESEPIRIPGNDRIDDPLRYDFDHYLPDDLLRKTDTASMAVALEVRAPFLARELIEAALRTPLDVLMPKGERKGLLKQVARKYLPDTIVDRPKQGFAIPIGEWFRSDYGSMRTLLYDHLESSDPFPGLSDAGVNISMDYVRRMLREHDAAGEKSLNPWHGRDHSQRLYMLLVLSIWAKWLASIR
ncbi:MAG: asparagine synthase (glutamine-hydrolyzing) [Phycisphaerales bacterium]|nr:asparagine synthase (glutamine-hydrolyzing) [Phycisphaerales bacterium]MCB9837178.1 asparagine synthase (glutamine-hydrolyzing) [Phycisphaera sp.]